MITKYNNPGVEKFYEEVVRMDSNTKLRFTKEQVDQMKRQSQPSSCIENFLTTEEFDYIRSFVLNHLTWHIGVDGADFIGIDESYQAIQDIIVPKLKLHFGDFKIESFFLRKSTSSLHVHTDHRWSVTHVPYKTFLIPLDVIKGDWKNVGTVTYDQYQYVVTLPKNESGFDKENIEGLITEDFSKDDYTHVSHENINHIQGLSIENVLTWLPCSLLAFDSTRLHSSNDWKKYNIESKWAITLLTSVPIR